MTTIEKMFDIVKVGWQDENIIPVVLINKKERENLSIDLNACVKVFNQDKSKYSLAYVSYQFRGLEQATINSCLAKILNSKVNDKIIITTEFYESDYEKFKVTCNELYELSRAEVIQNENSRID